MIWYSDERTQSLEASGDWVACVKYIHGEWQTHKDDISIFLKLAVTAWYALTLDGPELSLTEGECKFLEKSLSEAYHYFSDILEQNENSQWLFGYMMTVRTDLFLNSGLEYDVIAKKGELLIEKASGNGNLLAQQLYAMENSSKKNIKKCKNKIKEHILEYFDKTQEVDKYFIEMFTT